MYDTPSAKNCNRITDRIRNQYFAAASVLVLALVVFYRDIVFEGRTFLMETAAHGTMPKAGPYNYEGVRPGFVANDPGAIAWQTEPYNRFISKSIKKADFPLWNPYAGLAGSPLLADGHTGPLEPIQFLFFFLPDRFWTFSIDFQLLLRFFIAGFGSYLFARRQGIDFFGSMSAGIIFMLSSYFVTFGNHPQVKTEVLLPWVLYGYDRLVDPKDRSGFWFCALFIGWAIIAAMPEATFFALFLGTLWYFHKSILDWHIGNKSFAETKTLVLRYLASTALGFFISAGYLIPFLEFVLQSKSVHGSGTGGPVYALQLLPALIFQIENEFFLHLGFFATFCLVYALLSFKAWQQYQPQIIFFSVYALTFILISFGVPGINWIRNLPVFNQLIIGKYSIPSIVFCIAILTGIFIDRARNLPLSYKKLTLSLLIVCITFIGIPRIKNLSSLSSYSSDLEFIYGALTLIGSILMLLYIMAFYQRMPRFSHDAIQICFLLIVCAEPFFWGARIHRPDRFDPFQAPPFIDYLKKQQDFRIFGFDGTLYPNISTAYGISDIRWLHALAPKRAYDFSSRFIEANEVNTMRLTGTTLPISDKVFDLLNAKYILRQNSFIEDFENCLSNGDTQPYFGKTTINRLIYEQNRERNDLFPELPLSINGATRMSLFAHPPRRLQLDLVIPKETSKLEFSVGLNPKVYSPEHGDGVTFRVVLLDQDNRIVLFSRHIDPKNIPCHRQWFDESIDLERWAGKEVTLRFITTGGPNENTNSDWAYWGDIRLIGTASTYEANEETAETSYNLVYTDPDVLIYQNTDAFPRAFVVYHVRNVASFDHALNVMANTSLDLRQVGIVENLPMELENTINQSNLEMKSVEGDVEVIGSGELKVEVSTKSPGLLIVSEQYYPGWNAYVNGKPTQIYAVDGILRGIFLEAGEHVVEFKYRPLSFMIGGIVSAVFLFTAVFFLIFHTRASRDIVSN